MVYTVSILSTSSLGPFNTPRNKKGIRKIKNLGDPIQLP